MTALFEREVARCAHCRLVQFIMPSNLCRRCRKAVKPEEPEPIAAPLAPIALVPKTNSEFQIGATVRQLRMQRNLSQLQLATRMGVVRTYVSKIEAGKTTPTIALLQRFALGLQVDIPTLLGEPIDPFIAEIAPHVAQISGPQRSIILNYIRTAARTA